MPSRRGFLALAAGAPLLLASCAGGREEPAAGVSPAAEVPPAAEPAGGYTLVEGSRVERGFVVDDALETPDGRTLHFSLHVPSRAFFSPCGALSAPEITP